MLAIVTTAAMSRLSTFLVLVTLLLTLASFLPSLHAQPPPPPSPFRQPDTLFHGYDIRSFALDPAAPFMLINDANTFVHSIDFMHGGRDEMLYFNRDARIRSIAVTRYGRPLVIQSNQRGDDASIIFFDDGWRPTSNVSLRSVDPSILFWNTLKVLVDTNDYIYIFGFNNTGTAFVNILDGRGVPRDRWVLGTFPFGTDFAWTMDFANNIYLQQTLGATRPLRIFTSGGVLTDTLSTNLTGVDVISHIAVSPKGNIFLTAGRYTSTLLAFDANYRPLGRYSLSTVAYTITQLQFDYFSNLWVLDRLGEAVLALGPNGDLLGTVSSPTPSLYDLNALQYDRQSQSLLLSDFYTQPAAVYRIDGQDGSLVQTYTLPDRLGACFCSGVQVTGDGNIWMLLQCYGGPVYGQRVYVINRAGKIQREFPLLSQGSAGDFVLDPYEDRMFTLYSSPPHSHTSPPPSPDHLASLPCPLRCLSQC